MKPIVVRYVDGSHWVISGTVVIDDHGNEKKVVTSPVLWTPRDSWYVILRHYGVGAPIVCPVISR